MKKYILKADRRRPLKFDGVILGVTDSNPDEEVFASLEQRASESSAPGFYEHTRLTLYRTQGGKIILHTQRFGCSGSVDHVGGFNGIRSDVDVFDSFESYIASLESKNGKYGFLTVDLIAKVIEDHPEFEEFWMESID